MTKRELAVRISKETGIVQEDVQVTIQKALDYIAEALGRGDHIEFRNFGVFEICTRKARVGRNPKRPERTVRIPARRVVKFKPGKKMRALVMKSLAGDVG